MVPWLHVSVVIIENEYFVEIKDSNLSPILIRLRFIFAWESDELFKFARLVPLLIISNNVSKIASNIYILG